jgi:hypothetical protein
MRRSKGFSSLPHANSEAQIRPKAGHYDPFCGLQETTSENAKCHFQESSAPVHAVRRRGCTELLTLGCQKSCAPSGIFSIVVCTKQQLLQRVFAALSVRAPQGNYGSRPGRQSIAVVSPGISNTIHY